MTMYRMNNEEIQEVMNSTFSGLAIFCRDLDLEENLVSKYAVGQIIMERGFTDLTHRVGGMSKNCRYLVASSNGKDLSMFSPNPEFGHIVLQSNAYFKVLDIQKENGKTQILLLNIPEEGVSIFASSKINIEDQIIEKGIEIFNNEKTSDPIVDLQSSEWIERTSFPLGMSKEGVFFMDMEQQPPAQPEKQPETQPLETPEEPNVTQHSPDKPEPIVPKKKSFWDKLFGK